MSTQHYIGKVTITSGEYATDCAFRFKTRGNPDKYLCKVAQHWYGDKGSKEDGAYFFDAGCVAVTPCYCIPISEETYKLVSGILNEIHV